MVSRMTGTGAYCGSDVVPGVKSAISWKVITEFHRTRTPDLDDGDCQETLQMER